MQAAMQFSDVPWSRAARTSRPMPARHSLAQPLPPGVDQHALFERLLGDSLEKLLEMDVPAGAANLPRAPSGELSPGAVCRLGVIVVHTDWPY